MQNFSHLLQGIEERTETVKNFLADIAPELKTRVCKITDPLGPPGSERDFDAIVVSSETIGGALKINDVRAQQGFHPLQILITRRTSTASLSSTFIRHLVDEKVKK